MKSLPSRELRNSYQKISEYCHKTHKPICVTLNGCDDLIAMDSESYEHMMDLLALAQQLTSAKEEREVNCTPFVRQYDILKTNGVFLCQKVKQRI